MNLALRDRGPVISPLWPSVSSSTIRSTSQLGLKTWAEEKREWRVSEKNPGSRMTFSSPHPLLGISGAYPKERWNPREVGVGRKGLGSGSETTHTDNALCVCKSKPHSCPGPFFPTGVRELLVLSLVTTNCELEVGLQILPLSVSRCVTQALRPSLVILFDVIPSMLGVGRAGMPWFMLPFLFGFHL